MMSYPELAIPKKKTNWTMIILVLFLLISLGAFGYFFFFKKSKKGKKSVVNFTTTGSDDTL